MRIERRRVLWLLAGLPAACASPNPTLYTLAVVPGATHAAAPPHIELREIALAHYLQRSQIVRSSEDFRLDVLGNDWWGESLDAMVSRVLVQELSQRLPSSTVFAENGAITATPDASVELNIQRFDEDRSGALVLLAQMAVAGHATATRNVHFSVPPPSPGTPGLVSAMSSALGELADAIAELLTSPALRAGGVDGASTPTARVIGPSRRR
jgi:hypothetical protein